LLKRFHPDEAKVQSQVKQLPQVNLAQPKLFQLQPYTRTDPIQKKFEKDLLNWLITDSIPFRAVEGSGFMKLIRSLNEKLLIPHRITLQRSMNEEYKKVNLHSSNVKKNRRLIIPKIYKSFFLFLAHGGRQKRTSRHASWIATFHYGHMDFCSKTVYYWLQSSIRKRLEIEAAGSGI